MPPVEAATARNYGILPRLWPLVALLAIIAVIVLCASFAPVVLQRRATQGLINLVAVVGLYVFVGNSGVLSFGNVAFMAVGAYVSALLTMKPTAKAVFLPELPGADRACRVAEPAGRARRRRRRGRAGLPCRSALDAVVGRFGEHRDLRGAGRGLYRARQLDRGHRRAEFADGLAGLCRSLDRARLGAGRHRHRLRLPGNTLGAATARFARRRGGGAGDRRQCRAPSPDRVRHLRLSVRHRRRVAGAFPRHRAGREFLSRSHLPDRGDADYRRPRQSHRRGRGRGRDRGSDRVAAADRNRRSDRQDDDRRATRRRRRHPRTDHALDHSVPAKRYSPAGEN